MKGPKSGGIVEVFGNFLGSAMVQWRKGGLGLAGIQKVLVMPFLGSVFGNAFFGSERGEGN